MFLGYMKVLILGITSNIGYRFYKLNTQFEVFGVCRKWPENNKENIFVFNDITFDSIKETIDNVQPDIVINCLSVADVDACEKDPSLCEYLNYELVSKLVSLSNELKLKVIFFSSAIIYGGDDAPYQESDLAKPLNIYGKCKLKADKLIESVADSYLLFRPTAVFGVTYPFQRSNTVTFIANKLQAKQSVSLVDDVLSNVLFLDDLIRVISASIYKNINGTFNIGGDETVSRYKLGKVIQKISHSQDTSVIKCLSRDFFSLAQRPLNTALVNTKVKKKSGVKFTELKQAINHTLSEQAIIDDTLLKGNGSERK
ncbi:MAG: dTDP-4-dehydrorhamnose reductase [Alteromonadaceae bacterium]|jgi:dTDP-4-dehydrorhamnose reductase